MLAPFRLDVVLVDDSEAGEEGRSNNTGTGKSLPETRLDRVSKQQQLVHESTQNCMPGCLGQAAHLEPCRLQLPIAASQKVKQ